MSEENKKPIAEQEKPADDDVTIYEEAVSIDRSRQKSRKIFVFYIVGLFCVALCLILLSYIMQEHANQKLEDLGAQLTEQTDVAAGAKTKVDQLQATVDAMQKQLEENQKEADALNETIDEQKQAMDALNSLWQLERAWQQGDVDTALEIIQQMDKAYTRDALTDTEEGPLTGDAAEEYAAICEDLDA